MSTAGRKTVAAVTYLLRDKRPVYLVVPTLAPDLPIPLVAKRRAADYVFQVLLPEQTAAAPPMQRQRYTTNVSLYELIPFPRRAIAPAHQPP